MALTIADFIEQEDGLTVDDVPPEVQERVNDALAELTDGPGGGSPPQNPDAVIVSKNLDGRAGFTSIQDAIDGTDGQNGASGATSGDTIFVEPGTYEETVVVNKEGITLQSTQGRDQTSIGDPSGPSLSGPILRINSPDVVVDGFEIAGASGGNEAGQGIDVNGDANDTDGAELRNLAVRNNDDRGLVVDRSSNILIEDTLVEDNYDRGSMDGDPPEDGFSSSDDADGITLFFTDNSTIRNVTSRRNGDNGVYIKGDNNTVENVTVNANGDEGLDLSSDGSDVAGGATVTNLTTGGNDGQEIEIEGHSSDVTIESSSITIDTSSESGPFSGPAGIAVPEMDGGSVSITGTSFGYGDGATQAYISDGAGAVDLAATIDNNDFEFVAVQGDLDDDGTDDVLRPSKFVTEGVNQFDFSGDGEFTTDVVAESTPDGETAYAHITSGGTQTTDYATTAVSLTSPTVPEPPTLGELTSGTTLTYGYYAGPNNKDSAPDEVYLLVEETDGTRHVLYRASDDGSPAAGEWKTRNVHREISGNPDNNSGYNWFELTTSGRTNLGDGGSTSDLSNVYSDDAEVLAIAPGRGTTGGSGSIADVYYRDLRIGGKALGKFLPVSQTT